MGKVVKRLVAIARGREFTLNSTAMKRKILPLPELATKIKELAAESPHTLTDVLEYAGIPAPYISMWRNQTGAPRRAPYYHELAKVAEFLNKPVEVFIYADRDPYVHIRKDEYQAMLENIEQQLQKIEAETDEIRESDFFDYQKFIG